MNVADQILDIVADEGIAHIFGNPGSTEMPLLDALVDRTGIAYVLGLQEATAAGMAYGYSRASGRPSVLNLHAAGGLGNAMGLLHAMRVEGVPVVVTVGQQDTRHLQSAPWLAGDLVAMAQPAVKWAREAHRSADVGPLLRQAFAMAQTPPTGPVLLSLPMDLLDAEAGGLPPRCVEPSIGPAPNTGELAQRLAGFAPERVALLIGEGVPMDAMAALAAVAEAGGFAVYGCSLNARNAFRTSHPCWCGNLRPDFAHIRDALSGYDAVLLIGGRAFVAYPYRDTPPLPPDTQLFQLAPSLDAIERTVGVAFASVGALTPSLTALAGMVRGLLPQAEATARTQRLAAARTLRRDQARAAIDADPALTADAAALALLEALQPSTLVFSESATHLGPTQDAACLQPGQLCFQSSGVLGCAMPAAVGASFAHPGRTLSLSGDGGAMYSPQALWTAARYRTRTTFVVLNNRRYRVLTNVARQLGYPNAVAGRFVAMDLDDPPVDFMALGQTMGVAAERVATRQGVADAIAHAEHADGPRLIEVVLAG